MSDKPNIVYFHVDNLGYGELGCYGGGILRGARPTVSIGKAQFLFDDKTQVTIHSVKIYPWIL